MIKEVNHVFNNSLEELKRLYDGDLINEDNMSIEDMEELITMYKKRIKELYQVIQELREESNENKLTRKSIYFSGEIYEKVFSCFFMFNSIKS